MIKESQINNVGDIVLISPGRYLTEYHEGYNIPNTINIVQISPGIVLEDFVDRKLVLVSDGTTTTKMFVENNSIKDINE